MQELTAALPVSVTAPDDKPAVHFRHTPALDGLRGIAVLVVMLYHLDWLVPEIHPYVKGGFLGVDIFFVLSGFLITSILLGEYERTSTISLKNFYIRRFLRLLPAFWLFAICLYAFGNYLLPSQAAGLIYGRYDFAYALTYTMNWFSAANDGADSALNHVWSLSIEEQFYIIWSLVLYKAFSEKRTKQQLLVATIVFVGVLCVFRAVRAVYGVDTRVLYYSTDTRLDSLLIGCVTSMVFMWRIIPESFLKTLSFRTVCYAATGVILIVVLTYSHDDVGLFTIGLPAFSISIAVMIYWLMCSGGTIAHKLLGNRVLGWIGNVSYGLYLWHYLFYEFAKKTFSSSTAQIFVGVSLAFAMSAISFYFLERPFLRLKSRFELKLSKA